MSDDNATTQTTDHLGRDAKDFAIEFGEYLAKAAEHFQEMLQAEPVGEHDYSALHDAWRGLHSAIYEFRKRAAIANTRIGKYP
jgi:hypothetical protein